MFRAIGMIVVAGAAIAVAVGICSDEDGASAVAEDIGNRINDGVDCLQNFGKGIATKAAERNAARNAQ